MQFQVLGSVVQFDDDLIIFETLRKKYKRIIDEVSTNSIKNIDANRIAESSEYINNQYTYYANEIIREASIYGSYNKTIEDFVDYNTGYSKLIKTYEKFLKQVKMIQESTTQSAQGAIEQAAVNANREIQGLNYGIITSSMIDMIVYDCFNNSEIRRTTKLARKKFDEESSQILKTADNLINTATKQYINNVLKPEVISAINELFAQLLSMHTQILIECGRINSKFLNGIDEKRSDSLLNNVDIVGDKSKLIVQAINVCPYNVNAYILAYKQNLFDNDLIYLIKTFDLIDSFEPKALGITKLSTHTDLDFIPLYNKAMPYMKLYAELKDITINEVYCDIVRKTIKERNNKFRRLQAVCTVYSGSRIYEYFNGKTITHKYDLDGKFNKIVNDIINEKDYEFLTNTIGYNPIPDISNNKCSNYKEYRQYENDNFKKIVEKYNKQVDEIVKNNEIRIANEKKVAHDKEVRNKTLKISAIVIGVSLAIAFIVYVSVLTYNDIRKNNEYKAYVEELSKIPGCHAEPFAGMGFNTSYKDIINEFGENYTKKVTNSEGYYHMIYSDVNIFGLVGDLEISLTPTNSIFEIEFNIDKLSPSSKSVQYTIDYFNDKYPDVKYEDNGNIHWYHNSGQYIYLMYYRDGDGVLRLIDD